MWAFLLSQIETAIASWVAAGIDFDGVPVDFGPLAGGLQFQRYHFHGLAVDLQIGSGPDLDHISSWTSVLTVDFAAGGLENIATNVDLLWNVIRLTFEEWLREGLRFRIGGVLYGAGGRIGMDAVNGNVLKLVVEMEQFGEPLQIEHYFRRTNDAGVDPGSDISLVGDFIGEVKPNLLACMDVSVRIVKYRAEWRVRGGLALLPRTYIHDAAPAQLGTANSSEPGADASQLAYVISWYTNFAGRGERGRTFIPGTNHSFIQDNRVNDDGKTPLGNYADTLLGTFNGDDDLTKAWQIVLWRQHLTNPALVPDDSGEYTNPLDTEAPTSVVEWPGHDEEGKPIYVNPPTTRPPFSPAAGQHGITLSSVSDKIRTQRRRGPGVRISRGGHRTV